MGETKTYAKLTIHPDLLLSEIIGRTSSVNMESSDEFRRHLVTPYVLGTILRLIQ